MSVLKYYIGDKIKAKTIIYNMTTLMTIPQDTEGVIDSFASNGTLVNQIFPYLVKFNGYHNLVLCSELEIEPLISTYWQMIDERDKLLNKETKPIGCQHEFKNYIGLLETFQYCIKCDAKKGKAL